MKSIKNYLMILLVLPLFCVECFPEAGELERIIKKIDELYRSTSSQAQLEMTIVTPHWERTLVMDTWTSKMDRTFIRIVSPKKEKGISTLRLKTEMWNYLPKINKVIKIPPSMMMSSWMGSDFTNDDLVKESSMLDDYTYRLFLPEDAQINVVYVELKPKEDKPIVWGRITIAARKSDYLPVWEKYYDQRDNLMRVMTFTDIKKFGNRELPSVMEMVPQNKQGHKTLILYKDVKFDIDLDEEIFSLRNLRSRN